MKKIDLAKLGQLTSEGRRQCEAALSSEESLAVSRILMSASRAPPLLVDPPNMMTFKKLMRTVEKEQTRHQAAADQVIARIPQLAERAARDGESSALVYKLKEGEDYVYLECYTIACEEGGVFRRDCRLGGAGLIIFDYCQAEGLKPTLCSHDLGQRLWIEIHWPSG